MNAGDIYIVHAIGGSQVPVVILSAAAADVPGGGVTVATLADPQIAPDTVMTVPISAVGLVARCYDIRTIPLKRFADRAGVCTPGEHERLRASIRAYLDL